MNPRPLPPAHVAIHGRRNGELWLTDYRKTVGPTRTLLRAPGCYGSVRHDLGDIDAPDGYGSALAVTGALFLDLTAGTISGGTVAALALDHCHSINVHAQQFHATGRHTASLTNGCSNATVRFGVIHGIPARADFLLDESTQILLHATARQPRCYTVRRLTAPRPNLVGHYHVDSWHGLLPRWVGERVA